MQRWSGPLGDPNLAGVLLAASCTLALAWLGRSAGWRRLLPACATAAALTGVVATGSRSGLLSLGAGALVLAGLGIVSWRRIISVAGLLAVVVLAWPGSAGRVAAVAGDAGIGDRLRLWQATLALCADHPGGLAAPFIATLEDWYLDADLAGRFATPLNSLLALVARCGFLAMAGVMAVAAIAAALVARQDRETVIGRIGIALMTALACGAMSQGLHAYPAWILAMLAAGSLTLIALLRQPPRPLPLRPLLIAGSFALAAAGGLWFAAEQIAMARPWRVQAGAGVARAMPNPERRTSRLVLLAPSPRERSRLVRSWGRRALQSGWEVRSGDGEGVTLIERLGAPDACSDMPSSGPVVLLDPEMVPPTASGRRILVILRGRRDYVPYIGLERWAGSAATVVATTGTTAPEAVWRIIEDWAARSPGDG